MARSSSHSPGAGEITATDLSSRLLTVHELMRLYSQSVSGELIRGVLFESKPAGQEHGEIVMRLGTTLLNYIQPRRLGRLMGSDAGVWLERDPDTVREPDIGFFAAETSPPDQRVTGYAEVAPDLVVEIASPHQTMAPAASRSAPAGCSD